jgi:hypothetical protein
VQVDLVQPERAGVAADPAGIGQRIIDPLSEANLVNG